MGLHSGMKSFCFTKIKNFTSKFLSETSCYSNFPITAPHAFLSTSSTSRSKHWNPKFRKERAKKVLKIDLPDYDEERRQEKLSLEEMKANMKKKGVLPSRPWNEKSFVASCLGSVIDPYVPPEGDYKASIISKPGMMQKYDAIGKKGKSYMALKKIRSLDHEFDVPTVAEQARDIYIEAHKALATKDEDKLHELVTEKAFPEMMENVKNKIIKWNFIKVHDHPRITHIRYEDMVKKDNYFAQITVRLHSQQTLAIYDRFGRLMHGGEDILRDSLEYIVFERHMTNKYGRWRIHGKIIPDWLPPKEPINKTYLLPNVDEQFPEPPPTEISELNSESRPEAST